MSPDGTNRISALADQGGGPDYTAPDQDLTRARQLLAQEGKRRADAAAAELRQILEKHRCRLSTRQEWVDGQPTSPPQVIIVPVD